VTITIVGHDQGHGTGTSVNAVSWTNVGTINAGDLALLWSGQQTTTPSWSAHPAGFVIPAVPNAGALPQTSRTNLSGCLVVKRCAGGETGTLGNQTNGNNVYKVQVLLVLRGAGEIVAATANNGASAVNIDGVTCTNPIQSAIGVYLTVQQASGSAATYTVPTNYTEETHDSSTTNPSVSGAIFTRTGRTFEASGALRAVSTVNAPWADLTLYIADATAQTPAQMFGGF